MGSWRELDQELHHPKTWGSVVGLEPYHDTLVLGYVLDSWSASLQVPGVRHMDRDNSALGEDRSLGSAAPGYESWEAQALEPCVVDLVDAEKSLHLVCVKGQSQLGEA